MSHPYHHALSSVNKWGGVTDDYQHIHDWFDESKKLIADFRHRALRHHAEGIFMCESIFGVTIELSICGRCGKTVDEHPWVDDLNLVLPRKCEEFKAKVIPVRWIGEQHVREDMGFIPQAAQWLVRIEAEPWMFRGAKPLERLLSQESEMTPALVALSDPPKDWDGSRPLQ